VVVEDKLVLKDMVVKVVDIQDYSQDQLVKEMLF
jgi:hypothetical protein